MLVIVISAMVWYTIGYFLFILYQLRFGNIKKIDVQNGFKTALFGCFWILPIIVWVISDSLDKNRKEHE